MHSLKTTELKKHVAIIHSSNQLSLLERKIANALLHNAYDSLQKVESHTIHIPSLCKLIGYDSKDFKTIKKSLMTLISSVFEWNILSSEGQEKDEWRASALLSEARIKGSVCTYAYSPAMRNMLYHPEIYGKLNMLILAKFKSAYGLVLYENCSRFQTVGKTPWMDLNKFRKLMGIEEKKYQVFRDLKNRVIEKAVQEVNKHSNLKIGFEIKKHGRTVVAIQFFILINKPEILKLIAEKAAEDKISEVLKVKYGLTQKQIELIESNYDEQYIRNKIDFIQSSKSYKCGKIAKLSNYFISALEKNFTNEIPKTKNNVSTAFVNAFDIEKETQLDLAEKYRRFQAKCIKENLLKKKKSYRTTILKPFEKNIQDTVYFNIYRRDGLENPLILDEILKFLKILKHDLLDSVESYEKWLAKYISKPSCIT